MVATTPTFVLEGVGLGISRKASQNILYLRQDLKLKPPRQAGNVGHQLSTLRNIAEERRPHLHHSGSLQ